MRIAISVALILLDPLPASSGMTDPDGLHIIDLQLPDGPNWILGPQAIGRPFLAVVVLGNLGGQPIAVWDPHNTEGMGCLSVVLTDERGNSHQLKRIPTPRAGGLPTTRTLQPRQTITLELELLRAVPRESLPPGAYRLTAVYENKLPAQPPGGPVWIGRIESKPRAIRIVWPAPSDAQTPG